MTSLEKLIKHFERFPGIGSRQARRFAHQLLIESKENIRELSELIAQIQSTVTECESCFRFYAKNGDGDTCRICSNPLRDRTKLTIVERDTDMEAIERSGTYDGLYFILGGTVPLLESDDTKKLRGGPLKQIVLERAKSGLQEIILAFSVNPDGENTSRYVESLLGDSIKKYKITTTHLGRGLSTGSELEYADPETIKNALENRH
jgi:recombination protein RecR